MKLKKSDSEIKIRAHHLLCLLNFRGRGYNRNFVENMKRVVKRLGSDPTSPVIVTTEVDIICSACPYNKDGRCLKKEDSEEKVRIQDLKIIKKLGFKRGKKLLVTQAWEAIKKKILAKDLSEICQDCQWLEYCSQIYPKIIKRSKL